ncbi:MAG: hypothetical protein RMN53_11810 [Anaerolineae bacterium]|nr:hypothetical protein [Anaerolineae bacterium]
MGATVNGHIFAWGDASWPGLAEALKALQAAGLLPADQSWWFAWREPDILLPQRLGDPAALPDDWDELRVFSPPVEFRQTRQGLGWRRLLLAEAETLAAGLTGWQRLEPSYRVTDGQRVLWGRRLRLAGGERRGEVRFPRPLDYDVAGEAPPYERALVADVRLYYDAEARLHTARYTGLRLVRAGTLQVQPLP